MRDSALRLQDKTILLTGPFNGTTQAIIRSLTEFGCDVGFVSNEPGYAGKFVEGVNEAREVHPEYGRAVHLPLALGDEKQIQEAMGRIVESLGRMDALIDASPLAWDAKTDPTQWRARAAIVAEKLIPFLLAKQRGRVMYVMEDASLDAFNPSAPAPDCRALLHRLVEELALRHRAQNVTVNALSLGVTEDFVLKAVPKSPSIRKSLAELQAKPGGGSLKLVEFNDIGFNTAYLASVMSASLTGQLLRLTHGAHLV